MQASFPIDIPPGALTVGSSRQRIPIFWTNVNASVKDRLDRESFPFYGWFVIELILEPYTASWDSRRTSTRET